MQLIKKCLYEYANERSVDNTGTADTFWKQAKEEINDTIETKSTKETGSTVHTYDNEGTSKPDNTDNTNDTLDTSEELPVKNDSISNSYQEKYVRNLRKYLRRRNLIFEKAVDFIRTDDPGSYEKFVSFCLNGLSVSCVFGGDLYATFLSAHPNMTGLYEFLRKWIIKKHFTLT